ncbi:putative ferric-chelate reductase 1 [Ictalurus punctatus]|uniref:Ferric-chelate reductase 1 n=1 Tax=Ictalurus punctatus TaxID=7998 RepID=A0A2D0RCI7_ICTPU|nr:putative ferric-chelate reductase 1 [Ictalurus punctatus]
MEAKLIVVVMFVCAVCHGIKANLQTPMIVNTSITNTGCGSTKLCVSSAPNCDPSGNSSCFFSSIQVNNQTASIELSGTTSGYVALGLTASNQSEGGAVVFICGNSNTVNSTFFFNTATLNGTMLTSANVSTVNSVQGALRQNQSLVQCTFNTTTNLTINNSSNLIISNTSTFYITIMNGSSNGTTLNNATVVFNYSAPLVLTNSTVNVVSSTYTVQSPLNISRNGCGSLKMCLSTPSACEPAGSGCTFMSSKVNNQTIFFELSGRTSGYVALGLTKQNSTYVFVCGNNYNSSSNSSSFFFQTATQNGTVLTPASVSNVYYYQGEVTQTKSFIQCIFNITTNASDNVYNITIFSGTTNGTQMGTATTLLATRVGLDLSNSSAPLILITQNPQTNPANGCNSVVSLWTHVLAVLLSAMSLHFVTSHSIN